MKNIYFAVHPSDKGQKKYMFSCPIGIEVKNGNYYIVNCKKGKQVVKAITNSIVINDMYITDIMSVFGAEYLAETIGEHIEKDIVWGNIENGDIYG